MAVGYDYELYVDGTRVFYGDERFNIEISDTSFVDMVGSSIGSYTYNEGQYLGWTTTQGGTTPTYEVGDIFQVNGQVFLYSIPATSGGSMYLGTSSISKMYLGQNEVSKVYLGQDLVYEKQAPIMPVKSDLINIDITGSGTSQQFRVLKINGNIAEVLSMSEASSQQFASSGQTYENSNLDTYLNTTWYNTLSATAKQAIVDKTFRQDSWYWGTSGNPDYQGKYSGDTAYKLSLGNASFGNEITRHAYAISVQDVLDYLEVTPQMSQADTTLTYDNVWTMFWNSTTTHSGNIWLRSAYASGASVAFGVSGDYGYLSYNYDNVSLAVRPALTIDLSKINFTIQT